MKRALVPLAALTLLGTAACSNLNDTEQRTLTGTGAGLVAGTVIGAAAGGCIWCGTLVGGGIGAVAGYLYDQSMSGSARSDAHKSSVAHKSNAADPPQANAEASQLTKSVQSGLAKLGYDPGRADGVLGFKTRQAIREYEDRNNLPVDGKVTQDLWLHIKGDLNEG